MAEQPSIAEIVGTILQVIWILVFIASAGVAFYRLRATASGLLIGGSIVVLLLKSIALELFGAFGFAVFEMPIDHLFQAVYMLSALVSVACTATIGLGVVLVPWSLRRLSARDRRRQPA